ncbi:MAG: stage III sporulation protein AE, partial [Butyricicoccus sp.]|nr:stage III sporulation protein AE [Butyricicoccus sp.]
VIRGAVGVFGLAAVLAVCLTPFLKLGVRYVLLKACSALASPVCTGSMAKLIDAVGTACGMILGLVGSQTLMLYIAVISMLKAVGA